MRSRKVLFATMAFAIAVAGCSTQDANEDSALEEVVENANGDNNALKDDDDASAPDLVVAVGDEDGAKTGQAAAPSDDEPLTVETDGDADNDGSVLKTPAGDSDKDSTTASSAADGADPAEQGADKQKTPSAGDDTTATTQGRTATTQGRTASSLGRTATTEKSGTPTTQGRTTTTEAPSPRSTDGTTASTARPTDPTTQPTSPPATSPPDNLPEPPSGGGLLPVYTPNSNCSEGNTIPLGQAPAAFNFEPLGSIWCFDLDTPPTRTASVGSNSWVDDFTTNTLMQSLDDGEMGYRIYDRAGGSPGRSQHWINQNHWMVDAKEGFTGGASMRPDRSFRFENGKMIVEGDFAANIPEYGQRTWGEITITTASAPTGEFADPIYAYGQFGGHWSVGCRLQSEGVPICAVEGPNADSPPDSACFSRPGNYRVSEMSFFQRCGSSVMGGTNSRINGNPWRSCTTGGFDMACRDRFRMEVTKSSLTLYVNGVKFLEDANWPAAHQLPDSFINGDIYVYQSNWQNRAASRAYRYHWDHFAVNPSNGPQASEWYGRALPTASATDGSDHTDAFFCNVV